MHRHAICWLNGELLPAAQATLSVLDHGLLYGDGIFEGIRFYDRHAFRLDAHLDRLELSARAIALQIPYGRDALIEAIARTIAAFEEPDGYLRLVVTRGVGPMGLNPRGCGPATLFIVADQLSLTSEAVREKGARLIIAATRRLPPNGLDPRIKSLNYLNHILARIEANHAGVDEAVLLNGEGRVAEGTAENLFVVRGDTLLTPPTVEGALDGITRQCIIELAVEAGIPVRECPLAPYDLYTADECFLTGTGAELIPVRDIDGRSVTHCPGQIFLGLQARFAELVERETGPTAAESRPDH
ncbi:branched-chain-amino-acid transaminase [Imhoffiella purpurea]|uniref:Branched-chain-amino-acid aminotransferase n=1 Tax=Imhoffiella purpurea TaxID=1249627 RepID=W9V2H7_9GAMM|nr:branched-chain-amino-acid transaminase [Imhoffiella purpurea]EXJ13534.1 Branched-chain amino acid aminotransferase [Imhoffiella purpurea]